MSDSVSYLGFSAHLYEKPAEVEGEVIDLESHPLFKGKNRDEAIVNFQSLIDQYLKEK